MKIIFFVENNHAGGMDTFFINIINNWPFKQDKLCLICNHNHPGLSHIKLSVTRECQFYDHDIILYDRFIDNFFFFLPFILRKILRPFFRIIFFPYQLHRLKKIFREVDGDKLLSVNGAYPGGETSRIANIAWRKIGKGMSVHNIRNFAIPPRTIIMPYENMIDAMLERSVHTYIGVSSCCAESLRLRPILHNSSKIKYIYNGVPDPDINENRDVFDLRKTLNIKDEPICLMLSTYELRKGFEFLFNVFKELSNDSPDVNLVICGDSTKKEKSVVEQLRKNIAPKSKIHLLDFVPNGKALINQADILIVASQEWESFGWTVIEAMIRAVPVVSTNAGGLAEVIGKNGEEGFSLDKDDKAGFVKSISALIDDSNLRNSVGQKGKLRAQSLFSIDRMVHEYSEIIRDN